MGFCGVLVLLLLGCLAVARAHVNAPPKAAQAPAPRRSALVERLKVNITCDICKLFAALFDEGLRLNWTETTFLGAASTLCADIPLGFSKGFCDGVVAHRFGPVVYRVLMAVQGSTSATLCSFLHLCAPDAPDAAPPKPRPRPRKAPAKKRVAGPTRRIVQLTDVHFDQYYAAGSSQQSPGYSLACRNEFGTAPPVAGPYGAYGAPGQQWGCDTPLALLQSVYQYIGQLPYSIDAVVLTGDFVAHDIWQNNATEIASEVSFVMQLTRNSLPPTLRNKVFFVQGNHDLMPADQFRLPQEGSGTFTADLLNTYATLNSFLGPTESDSIRAGGFYSTLMLPGLRLVSLNTQYGDMINFWLYAGDGTGGPDQMQWLNNTLSDARRNNELVFIASHMPCTVSSGVHDFFCAAFTEVIAPYADIIVAMVGGHTHRDSWVTYTRSNVDLVQYVTPSLTPFSFKNPGFRVFTLVGNTVTTVDTYVTDISKTGVGRPPVWRLEYSLPRDYGMRDLSSASFDTVATNMLTNTTLWMQFLQYAHCSVSNVTDTPCITHECLIERYCSLTSPLLSLYNECITKFGAGATLF